MDGYYLDNSYTVFSDVVYADNKFKAKLKLFDLYKDLGLNHRKGCDLDADNIPVKRYPDKDLVGYRLEYMTSERAYNESKISSISKKIMLEVLSLSLRIMLILNRISQ